MVTSVLLSFTTHLALHPYSSQSSLLFSQDELAKALFVLRLCLRQCHRRRRGSGPLPERQEVPASSHGCDHRSWHVPIDGVVATSCISGWRRI